MANTTPIDNHPSKNPADWGISDSVGLESLDWSKSLTIKMGFDPTAPDLHLGHAVGLFALRRLQDFGHQVQLVVGDFTAAIGDPTGRNDMRPKLSRDKIKENAKTYSDQAMQILDPEKTKVVYNSSWLEALGAAGMIELASQATVAQMLARDDFSKRFKEQAPIGAHELLYPLLQARDSVELRPDMEFGGSDQRFNLLMGRELMKAAGQKPQACAMVGLLVGLDGKRKMSKSLGNHIGLAESADEIFAKTMSISDEAMEQWRHVLGASSTLVAGDPMESKKRLGLFVAGKLAGMDSAEAARKAWENSRQKGDWNTFAQEMSLEIPEQGAMWSSLLRDWGWESSARKARERIAQGALRWDGEKITDPKAVLLPGANGLARYGSKHAAKLLTALAPNTIVGGQAPQGIKPKGH